MPNLPSSNSTSQSPSLASSLGRRRAVVDVWTSQSPSLVNSLRRRRAVVGTWTSQSRSLASSLPRCRSLPLQSRAQSWARRVASSARWQARPLLAHYVWNCYRTHVADLAVQKWPAASCPQQRAFGNTLACYATALPRRLRGEQLY